MKVPFIGHLSKMELFALTLCLIGVVGVYNAF